MKVKIFAFALIALVLVVALSGCVSTPSDTTDAEADQQELQEQQNEVLSEIESEVISENETVEIGEMI